MEDTLHVLTVKASGDPFVLGVFTTVPKAMAALKDYIVFELQDFSWLGQDFIHASLDDSADLQIALGQLTDSAIVHLHFQHYKHAGDSFQITPVKVDQPTPSGGGFSNSNPGGTK